MNLFPILSSNLDELISLSISIDNRCWEHRGEKRLTETTNSPRSRAPHHSGTVSSFSPPQPVTSVRPSQGNDRRELSSGDGAHATGPFPAEPRRAPASSPNQLLPVLRPARTSPGHLLQETVKWAGSLELGSALASRTTAPSSPRRRTYLQDTISHEDLSPGPQRQSAFVELKSRFSSAPVLVQPDPSWHLTPQTLGWERFSPSILPRTASSTPVPSSPAASSPRNTTTMLVIGSCWP
ncbi:uncharacterized protein LOC123974892 [Micropterus dolomieu]|uniref:uncharacterized protein LOC123974892 n=1 Tax=Micropterus dolomieu TaxID=147949 RepID=UPI001E8E57E6|nr:uncharacterized protein LOC123974892 [Micropterus dolomieu]XP_045911862.1 uncharacterized protein LOC123974892 [Micropterus dolomieu]